MKARRFRAFLDEILAARDDDEVSRILYREEGVDMAYQHNELTWEDHERLFRLAGKLEERR